jgi:hypothetical protein
MGTLSRNPRFHVPDPCSGAACCAPSRQGRPVQATNHRPLRELTPHPGVQCYEDARNLTSLRARRRSPAVFEQPTGSRRRKNLCTRSQHFSVEVCDVHRIRPQHQSRFQTAKRLRRAARLFRRRQPRATRTRTPHSPPRPDSFRRRTVRHSHRDRSGPALWKTRTPRVR